MNFAETLKSAKKGDLTFDEVTAATNLVLTNVNAPTSFRSGAFDGAATDRITAGWPTSGGSPDSDILDDLPALRARSRDVEQNNGRICGITQTLKTNIIGKGIRPRPMLNEIALGISPEAARGYEEEMEFLFGAWVPHADAGRRLDFYALQRQSMWAQIINGESIYLPQSVKHPKSPVSFRLFGVESDRLETPPEMFSKSLVQGGVKVGAQYGEPQRYYFRKVHPGSDYALNNPEGFTSVKAEDATGRKLVFHTFDQKRSGQTRGLPWFHSVLRTIYDQEKYIEAERLAALLGACIGLIINEQNPSVETRDALTTIDGQPVNKFVPGMVWRGSGIEIEQVNPMRPGDNFAAFMKDLDRSITNAVNLSYEIGMGDYSHANYSTLRAALVDARRGFAVEQSLFIHSFCQPSWEWVFDEAVLSGAIKLPGYFEKRAHWLKALWVPHGYDWVDPKKEVEAAVLAVENNLITISEVVAGKSGGDSRDTIKQRGIEVALLEAAGIAPVEKKPAKTSKTEEEDEDE
jgi:lambda family phage portal protein